MSQSFSGKDRVAHATFLEQDDEGVVADDVDDFKVVGLVVCGARRSRPMKRASLIGVVC